MEAIDTRAYTTKSLEELILEQDRFLNKNEYVPVPYNPETDAYWKKVFTNEEKPKPTMDEFKRAIRDQINVITNDRFEYTDEHKRLLSGMCNWVYKKEGIFDIDKGILLIGSYGTGKTTVMKVFCNICHYAAIRPFQMCYAKSTTDQIEESKDDGIMVNYRKGDWCLDELGSEKHESNIWGNKKNIFGDLLEYRYNRKLITHGTTNMGLDQLKTIYGDRVYSRLHSMFNFYILNGKDYRIESRKQ